MNYSYFNMKTCFKCGRNKPRTGFYAHPKTRDGLLGKCKGCTRKDVSEQTLKNKENPEWVELERERCRKKYHKRKGLGFKNRVAPPDPLKTIKWRRDHPQKVAAHQRVARAIKQGKVLRLPCERCGSDKTQAHHEDYTKPLEVSWLCAFHHGERHRELNREKRAANLKRAV